MSLAWPCKGNYIWYGSWFVYHRPCSTMLFISDIMMTLKSPPSSSQSHRYHNHHHCHHPYHHLHHDNLFVDLFLVVLPSLLKILLKLPGRQHVVECLPQRQSSVVEAPDPCKGGRHSVNESIVSIDRSIWTIDGWGCCQQLNRPSIDTNRAKQHGGGSFHRLLSPGATAVDRLSGRATSSTDLDQRPIRN